MIDYAVRKKNVYFMENVREQGKSHAQNVFDIGKNQPVTNV